MLPGGEKDRILFLDNLRYLMVLLVVVLHAGITYSSFNPWWCVKEANTHAAVFDNLLLFLDSFLMPILFFIAGYFAISSFKNNGTRGFLKRKLKRLGLPLLLVLPLIGPTFTYIFYFTRYGFAVETGFGRHWLNWLKAVVDLRIGVMNSIDQFSHAHLWFMSLLLFFFVAFVFYAAISKRFKNAIHSSKENSAISILILLVSVGLLSAISTFLSSLIFARPDNPEPWVIIGNLLMFQPDRVVSYMLYFSLGVYGYHHRWFLTTTIPGHHALWIGALGAMAIFYLIAFNQLMKGFSIETLFLFLTLRSFLCVSCLAAFTLWAARYWNRPSKLNARLAVNSYHIYIVHLTIVIILQLILTGWPAGSVFVKFAIVSLAAILASFAIGHYALRPYPRASIAAIYAIFVLLAVSLQPTTT